MRLAEEEVLIRDDSGLMHGGEVPQPRQSSWCRKLTKTLCLSLGFFVLGLCVAIPGPTLLDLGDQVKATTTDMMLMFVFRSVGYIVGSVIGGVLFDYFNKQLLLCCAFLVSAVATLVIPWCLTLISLGAMFGLQGITMGGLDTGGNVLCLQIWGKKNGPFMQTLHFAFGIGAFIAPLLAKPFLSNDIIGNTTAVIQGNVPVAPYVRNHFPLNRSSRSGVSSWQLQYHDEINSDSQFENIVEHFDKLERLKRQSSDVGNGMNVNETPSPLTNSGMNLTKVDTVGSSGVLSNMTNSTNGLSLTQKIETGIESEDVLNSTKTNKTTSNEVIETSTLSLIPTENTVLKPIPKKPSGASDRPLDKNTNDGNQIKPFLENHKDEIEHPDVEEPNTPPATDDKSVNKTSETGSSSGQNLLGNGTSTKGVVNINVTQMNDSTIQESPKVILNGGETNVSAKGVSISPNTTVSSQSSTNSSIAVNTTTTSATTTTTTTTAPPPPKTTTTTTAPPPTTTTTTTSTAAPPPPRTTTTTTTTSTTTTTAPTTTTIAPPQKPTNIPSATPNLPQSSPQAADTKDKKDQDTPENVPATSKIPITTTQPGRQSESVNLSSTVSPNVSTTVISTTEVIKHSMKPNTTADGFLNTALNAVKNLSKIQFAYVIIGLALFSNSVIFFVLYCCDRRSMIDKNEIDDYIVVKRVGLCFKVMLVLMLGIFFFCYVGVEVTYGALVTTFAVDYNHWPKTQGAIVAAIFWGALATGRGLSIFIAGCCKPAYMLVMDMVLMVVGGLVLAVGVNFYDKLLWLGTLVLGLGMSSVFPTGITWAADYFRLTGKSTAVFVVGSALGQMVVPAVTGWLFETRDAMVLMHMTLGLSVVGLVIFIIMQCCALQVGNSFVIQDRNGFLPLDDEEEDDGGENMEMDLIHFDKSQTRRRKDRRAGGDSEYRTLISDLDDD